jgi:hypothetical protein
MSALLSRAWGRRVELSRWQMIRRFTLSAILASALLGASCAPLQKEISLKKIEWEQINLDETPGPEDYPGASAVFLLDEGEFAAKENFVFTHHVIIKILDEAGLDYANVEIPFYAESEVHNLQGRTIRKDGSVVGLKPENIHEKSIFPDFVLYSDDKAKVFALPGAETGSVVEYSYSIVYKGPFPSAWEFQREEPVLLSTFTLDVPSFAQYNYLLSQRKGIKVEKSVSHPTGRMKAVFSLKDAPPITPEPLMPPISEVTTKVYFCLTALSTFGITVPIEGDSWEILGKSYWLATEDKLKADKAITRQVKEITKGCSDDADKIARIYDFVQSQIRYVAIEMKEGRVMPHDPSEVFLNRYGDCKDKAFLLMTMLKEAGVEAFPVLARTNDAGEVIEDFVSRQQFNHMAVAVPAKFFSQNEDLSPVLVRGDRQYSTGDDFVLLDATSAAVPFGRIPWYLENTKALVVTEEDSRLVKVPSSRAADNSTIHDCHAEILEDGSLSCSVRSTRSGQEASSTRSFLQSLTKTEQREWLEKSLSRSCPGAVLNEHSISQLSDLDQPLVLEYKFVVPQYVQRIDTLLVFSPAILRNPMFDEFTREKREHSIALDYPKSVIDGIKIRVPENFKINSLPEPEELSSDFADFSYSCFTDGENMVVNRQVAFKKTHVGPDQYADVKSFFESVQISQRRNVSLSSK